MVDLLNLWSSQWLGYLIPLVLQNTIFLLLIVAVLSAFRRLPAKTAYAIGLIGLLKLFIPALLPLPVSGTMRLTELSQVFFNLPGVDTNAAFAQSASASLNLSAIVLMVWISISILMLASPVLSLVITRLRLRNSELVETRLNQSGHEIDIFKSASISLPLTIGIFSKRIYVPELWSEWNPNYREMAIRHELAHINNHDGLTSSLQVLAQAIYFFHPLVWILNRQINGFREMACDERAHGDQPGSSIIYSRFLVDIAEHLVYSRVDCPTSSSLLKRKKELLNRIKYLTEDKMKMSKSLTRTVMLTIISSGLLLSWNCQQQGITASGLPKVVDQTTTSKQVPEVKFIPYDSPPQPVGGYATIHNNVVYPESAVNDKIEGTVIIQAYISENGEVTATKILRSSNDISLDEAGVAAIKNTMFNPARQRDKSVGVWVSIPVNFNLSEDKPAKALNKPGND